MEGLAVAFANTLGKYVAKEGTGEPTRWGFYDEEEERLSGW